MNTGVNEFIGISETVGVRSIMNKETSGSVIYKGPLFRAALLLDGHHTLKDFINSKCADVPEDSLPVKVSVDMSDKGEIEITIYCEKY